MVTTTGVAQAPPTTRPRSVLTDPAFLRLWTGTTASGLATWSLPFILGLAVVERSLTPTGLGIALAARTVGFLAAVPVSGVLADRYPRRRVVLWSGLAAAAAAPVIALGLGWSVWVLAAGAAVAGAGQGACRPAFQALTAEVVKEDRRQQANAATTFAVRVSTLAGPGLTAVAATVIEVRYLLLGTGVLWLSAALVPPPGTRTPSPTTDRPGFVAEFLDGVAEARRHPWFGAGLVCLTTVIATGYSVTNVVLPMISRDRPGAAFVLPAATTAYIIGALIGAVLVSRWRPVARGHAALAGLALYGVVPVSMLLPVHPAVIIAAYVIAGIGIELFNVPWFTAAQREVHPDRLARVSSLDFLLSYGLAPVGLALIAPATAGFGLTPVLVFCAAACLLAPLLAMLVPTTRRFARDSA